jgi:uncharacterized protein (TIGR02453 family)
VTFSGFPEAALTFYARLEADNTKTFWTAHRQEFETAVRAPMLELCEALSDYGPFHLFRPYNDQRFAKGRDPYKTQAGAFTESEGGAGYYLQLSSGGLMAASGYYAMAADQLDRFRAAVDDDASGSRLEALVGALPKTHTQGAISELKTAPRGFARDHPRIGLLRRKGLMIAQDLGAPAWLHTSAVPGRIRRSWRIADEVNAWLDQHVGPSTLPPPDFAGR